MKIIWPVVGMLVTLSILALPIAFWLIRRSALKQEPLTDGGALEFPITRGMPFLIDSVVIALIGFSVLILGTALISEIDRNQRNSQQPSPPTPAKPAQAGTKQRES